MMINEQNSYMEIVKLNRNETLNNLKSSTWNTFQKILFFKNIDFLQK
jgi:hypothetical protein